MTTTTAQEELMDAAVIKVGRNEIVGVEIVRLEMPDMIKALSCDGSLRLYGVASVGGVEATFTWDEQEGEVAWDELEVLRLDADWEYVYLLAGRLEIGQEQMVAVERALVSAVGAAVARSVRSATSAWAENWAY
jgi:hypothetical protein